MSCATSPGCRVSAHLLIPGFVFTGLTASGRTEKPAGGLDAGADGRLHAASGWRPAISTSSAPTTTCRASSTRSASCWAAGDIVENRPALSRWHPDYAEAFAAFVKGS